TVFGSGLTCRPSHLADHLCCIALEECQLIDCPMQEVTLELARLGLLNSFPGVIWPVKLEVNLCEIEITNNVRFQTLTLFDCSQVRERVYRTEWPRRFPLCERWLCPC